MKIIKANSKDIKELLNIENEAFGGSGFELSRASFYYHIRKNFLYVAKDENLQILGYILVFSYLKIPRIYSIATSKKARNSGVATMLLKFVFNKFNFLRLEVRKDNANAINLYNKFGFKVEKILSSYYPDGCDALFMVKK